MQRVIDPMAAEAWIVATLLATSSATTLVNGDVVDVDAVAFFDSRFYPGRSDFEPAGWPFVVYSGGAGQLNNYAEQITLAEGDYLIRSMARQDKLPDANLLDVEEFNKAGALCIQAAFQGVGNPAATGGIVHGCQIRRFHRAFYGEPGRMVSEMGVIAHIWSS